MGLVSYLESSSGREEKERERKRDGKRDRDKEKKREEAVSRVVLVCLGNGRLDEMNDFSIEVKTAVNPGCQ